MASMLVLGASAVSVGTRFIACKEALIDQAYKDAVIAATPEDIVMTTRLSGTPAAVINTGYVKKIGLELPWYLKFLKDKHLTKKYIVPLIHFLGSKALEEAALGATYKTIWSAGQSVGLVEEILSCQEIVEKLVREYDQCLSRAPKLNPS